MLEPWLISAPSSSDSIGGKLGPDGQIVSDKGSPNTSTVADNTNSKIVMVVTMAIIIWGYIGITEKMETTISGLGFRT